IFTHNHPSGEPDPSDADRRITQRLKEALGLIEVRVLDHIVVGGSDSVSFAERGYL
ncbi:JAB domain-containing protein, partial [Halomonas sp. PBN3]